jgi:hypothetical protein
LFIIIIIWLVFSWSRFKTDMIMHGDWFPLVAGRQTVLQMWIQ